MIGKLRNLVWASALTCISLTALNAQSLNYPASQIEFSPESTGAGETVLAITKSETQTVESKWNTFTVRVPGQLIFNQSYVLSGEVLVDSMEKPNHLGLTILFNNGKMLYAKAPLSTGKSNKFSIPLSKFVTADNAKNKDAVTEQDRISGIRVYASYSNPSESNLTLESLELTNGQ
ncbi:hypothetical protein [Cerasicoccus frondis]|uniref:hypothetical protein n=1 Tax=Cerasicoccus frondis TaxID=490090 RepID=UPI0028524B06|nr:hypothetical protein [Cerasicoccus frondis]